MRELLEQLDAGLRSVIVDRHVSADGARKYVLRLHDGSLVETVGIPHGEGDVPDRLTVCYSMQAGCAMGCAFCATGRQGLRRNLAADEMLWQLDVVERDFGCAAASAIAMGQGEPLANYAALVEALARFCEGLDVRVSLLQYNRVEGIPFEPSAYGKMALWALALRQRGIEASINKPRGADVSAACGQLANRYA